MQDTLVLPNSQNNIIVCKVLLLHVDPLLLNLKDDLHHKGSFLLTLHKNFHLGRQWEGRIGRLHSINSQANIDNLHQAVIFIFMLDIPNFHKNLSPSLAVLDKKEIIQTILSWEAESVHVTLEEAVLVVVLEEVFPHAFFFTDKASNHLELADVLLYLV